MKTCLLILSLLASAYAVSVKSKPHGKHQVLPKSSHTVKEKDIAVEEAETTPTFITVEASSQEQDEDMNYEDDANVYPYKKKGAFEVLDGEEGSLPILLSDEALVDIVQKESEEEEVQKEEEEEEKIESEETQSKEAEMKGEVEDVEVDSDEEDEEVLEEEEEEVEEEMTESEETLSKSKEEVGEDEEVDGVSEKVEVEEDKEMVDVKNVKAEKEEEMEVMEDEEESAEEVEEQREKSVEPVVREGAVNEEAVVEEMDSSTASEIPVDLDYASDIDLTKPLETGLKEGQSLAKDVQILLKEEDEAKVKDQEEKASEKDEITIATNDYEPQQDMQEAEATESQEVHDQDKLLKENKDEEKSSKDDSQEKVMDQKDTNAESDLLEIKNSVAVDVTHLLVESEGGSEEKNRNESANHTKGKARKQRKNHRVRKHPPPRDEARPGEGVSDHQGHVGEKEPQYHTTDNVVYKPTRRRAGKWATQVGMNPVQIRASMDLYPSARPLTVANLYQPEPSTANPCDNFHCKRGKTCTLNEEKKPVCVCQEPSACPLSGNDFDHVCGTDNVTYDTSCQLFATKCKLEGTKRGHRFHLDYSGPCKFIAPCMNAELIQFPLRMRDWLKNVLLQLFEHDSMSPGFLTPKQRIRVKKIHESERRLHAGDHTLELLAQDFEKNYNMYIYPVHWQFAQMDQHPSDRFLSHSEMAPLRVPLVPMEHCTSRFFQECDADKDKMVSFREWAHCFGIKEEDMDVNLLF
ncbi:hypothetical protein UPYG_G00041350 [Umbra pygmaea]|uniref:Kazal-like domain-containing protein n=1 Tax=Umbra pygmaea TaxID=75934 RepID=A0ABD0XQ56_UMBPY